MISLKGPSIRPEARWSSRAPGRHRLTPGPDSEADPVESGPRGRGFPAPTRPVDMGVHGLDRLDHQGRIGQVHILPHRQRNEFGTADRNTHPAAPLGQQDRNALPGPPPGPPCAAGRAGADHEHVTGQGSRSYPVTPQRRFRGGARPHPLPGLQNLLPRFPGANARLVLKGPAIGLFFLFQLVAGVFSISSSRRRQAGLFKGLLPFELKGVRSSSRYRPWSRPLFPAGQFRLPGARNSGWS